LDGMSKKRYESLSEYISKTRVRQSELADMVGVTPSAISLYLKGKRIPVPEIALRLSKVCNVSLETILTRKAA